MKTIFTERLSIRDFKAEDGEDLYEYLSDPEVVHFEPYEPFSREEAYAESARRSGDEAFMAVCLGDKVIGNIYLGKGEFGKYEIGYVFNRNYWHKGYASEAAKAVADYAFDALGARKLSAGCDKKNPASSKLLERIGLKLEGCAPEDLYFKKDEKGEPIWIDSMSYGLLKKDRDNA